VAETDDTFAEGFGKLALGAGVGFGLYLLVTALGFGGRGRGRGGARREEERTPETSARPPSVPPPARPRDAARLTFTMFEGDPAVFRFSGTGESSPPFSVDELIARVRAGGRSDVNLHIRGTVVQHAADEALARLKAAKIEVFRAQPPRAP
jgi:hypothetical protein